VNDRETARRGSSVLAVGCGTAVAMWTVGYLSRLPAVLLPSPLLLGLVLACLLAGGWLLGRYDGRGWRHGAAAGLLSGTISLMVLGSLLAAEQPNRVVPSAWVWLPGSILCAGTLAAAGAEIGRRRSLEPPAVDWLAVFVRVAAVAVLLLLVVGGLVTSTGAGLAVADWPNSLGYNMFLYPFSRMTGGIYFEHAHRLFGALVGCTTLGLAIELQALEARRWVRVVGWSVLGLVVTQGVLGGLRVTGGFTLSTSPEALRPSVELALLHGVLGQIVFALLVALVAFSSPAWRAVERAAGDRRPRRDLLSPALLVVLLLAQLVLGAAQRHLGLLLIVHIVFGVAVVAPAALHLGLRAWVADDRPRLSRLGLGLTLAVALQVLLGLAAFVAVRGVAAGDFPHAARVLLTTAHQGFGAALLGLAVSFLCWSFRLPGGTVPERPR